MPFSPGPGDLIVLAEKAHAIYRFCRDAPDDVQEISDCFENVDRQLRYLSKVLEVSGWPAYDEAAQLKTSLEKAEQFFAKYEQLAEGSGTRISRAWKTTRLGVDQNKMESIKKDMAKHMAKMETFKQNVILLCTIRRLQRKTNSILPQDSAPTVIPRRLDQRAETSPRATRLLLQTDRTDPKTASIICEATDAFEMARQLHRSAAAPYRPRLETVASRSPDTEAIRPVDDKQMIDEFIDEALSISENTQLYSRTQSYEPNIEALKRISRKARTLRETLVSPRTTCVTNSLSTQLPVFEPSPEYFPDSFFSSLSKETEDMSVFHRWAPPLQDPAGPHGMSRSSIVTPAASIHSARPSDVRQPDVDEIFSLSSLSLGQKSVDIGISTRDYLELTGWAAIFVPGHSGIKQVKCRLEMTNSEGSVCLWAIATDQRRASSLLRSPTSPVGLTPHLLLRNLPLESALPLESPPQSSELARTFRHLFHPDSRPFPSVLHPSVEGPEEELAPYAFLFREKQFLAEEGLNDSGKWITGLKYAFEHQADRDLVRQKVFGKTLLASAGTEEISFGAQVVCHQQAVSLWKDPNTQTHTITFSRISTRDQSPNMVDGEYQVLGLEGATKEKILAIVVKLPATTPMPSTRVSPSSRRSSGLSDWAAKSRRSMSWGKGSPREDTICTLEFSDVKEKKRFTRGLNEFTRV